MFADSADLQERASYATTHAMILRAEGKAREALAETEVALAARTSLGSIYPGVKMALAEAVEASFTVGDLAKVRELIAIVRELPAGETTPFQEAQANRFEARLAAVEGDAEAVGRGFKTAAGLFREIGTPFWLGEALLEHGEWLVEQRRAEDAVELLREALDIFTGLRARPWIERVERLGIVHADTTVQ
jgi:tetratricopeptide (TPR) repeat protein